MKSKRVGSLVLLHFTVFIFGFTGVIGKFIEAPSDILVWWRMAIASVAIGLFAYGTGKIKKSLKENAGVYALVGLIIAAHWITFFEAIKVSNVSVTLACLSAASLFTALLEPLFFKRKIDRFELLFGAIVVAGLLLIFSFEIEYKLGIILALTSAFLASLFTTINGKLIQKDNPYRISLVEMMAGMFGITAWLAFQGNFGANMLDLSNSDWMWLIILGVICTAFAFVASIKVMEELTPFTVSLSINLEPVYGIILALLFFKESEKMTPGFYGGTVLILLALYLNAIHRKGKLQKYAAKIGRILPKKSKTP